MSVPYKTYLVAGLCICGMTLIAQRQSPVQPSFGTYLGSEHWIQFNSTKAISPSTVWSSYGTEMGLGSNDKMSLEEEKTDRLGWTHYRYQQIHLGVPVEFATFYIHDYDNHAVKGNGSIAKDVDVDVQPNLTRDQAFDIAVQCVGAGTYYWQVPQYEMMKREAMNDPDASFYPEGELLIVDNDFDPHTSPAYRLAWKFDIAAAEPESHKWIYVDALNGSIVKELDLEMHEGYPGMAETRYSGLREIITDSTEAGYVLRDDTRGRGVMVLNAVDSTEVSYAIDFLDTDNYWEHPDSNTDDAATDAFWGAEQYYDYLLYRHGINSYDDNGSKLICFIHYDKNWRNASWVGFWTRYGDANGNPWTYIDVVGHEFTHGFTSAHSKLIYYDESGALNESYSDIMGETLQRYTTGNVDWYATPAPGDTIRNYRDTKAFDDPNTYHGEHWAFTESDNRGVHTNSGVQNHWFYLLVEGGSGTNDNGDTFDVTGIGYEAAIDIVMRNMTTYLFPTSDYFDARQGTLLAAEDIFGTCSFEYREVANAWYAVGVGDRVDDQDFSVVSVDGYDLCTVDGMAPVQMHVKYLGCDSTGPVTLLLNMTKSNPLRTVVDTLDLPEGVGPGETIDYVFKEEFDFSRKGEHVLTGKVSTAGDQNTNNDIARPVTVFHLAPVSEQEFPFHNRISARTFRDSMAMMPGEFTKISFSPKIGVDSTYGVLIEAAKPVVTLSEPTYVFIARPVYEGQDVFDINAKLGARICFCVDATNLDSLGLQFDLRQTYTSSLDSIEGISADSIVGLPPQPKSCAMRVIIDTTELGRFFPETKDEDDWQTHNYDLENYLGTQFTLCFETRTFQSLVEDVDSIGDRVLLDNIKFLGREVQAATFSAKDTKPLVIYPNPVSDVLTVSIPSSSYEQAEMTLQDPTGRCIVSQKVSLVPGENQALLHVGAITPGVYYVEIRTSAERRLGKVVVQ